MKNSLLFTYSTKILVRLLTVNMKNCLTRKIRKCATRFYPIQRHIPLIPLDQRFLHFVIKLGNRVRETQKGSPAGHPFKIRIGAPS